MTRRYLRADADPRPCGRCGLVLPLSAFGVYLRGGQRRPRTWCMACCREATQAWRLAHRTELLIRRRQAYASRNP